MTYFFHAAILARRRERRLSSGPGGALAPLRDGAAAQNRFPKSSRAVFNMRPAHTAAAAHHRLRLVGELGICIFPANKRLRRFAQNLAGSSLASETARARMFRVWRASTGAAASAASAAVTLSLVAVLRNSCNEVPAQYCLQSLSLRTLGRCRRSARASCRVFFSFHAFSIAPLLARASSHVSEQAVRAVSSSLFTILYSATACQSKQSERTVLPSSSADVWLLSTVRLRDGRCG